MIDVLSLLNILYCLGGRLWRNCSKDKLKSCLIIFPTLNASADSVVMETNSQKAISSKTASSTTMMMIERRYYSVNDIGVLGGKITPSVPIGVEPTTLRSILRMLSSSKLRNKETYSTFTTLPFQRFNEGNNPESPILFTWLSHAVCSRLTRWFEHAPVERACVSPSRAFSHVTSINEFLISLCFRIDATVYLSKLRRSPSW